MNPYIPTGSPLIDEASPAESGSAKIYSTGGLGLAGLFGGPVAVFVLVCWDLFVLGRRDLLGPAAAWYVPLILFWLFCIDLMPPDLISQWIVFIPQTILWWMVARHLFNKLHQEHSEARGLFHSRWLAVGFAFLVYLIVLIVFVTVAAVTTGQTG